VLNRWRNPVEDEMENERTYQGKVLSYLGGRGARSTQSIFKG